MPFRDTIKFQAFRRSRGRCECTRRNHSHFGQCRSMVSRQQAMFGHKRAEADGGGNTLANCEVLCPACYLELQANGGAADAESVETEAVEAEG